MSYTQTHTRAEGSARNSRTVEKSFATAGMPYILMKACRGAMARQSRPLAVRSPQRSGPLMLGLLAPRRHNLWGGQLFGADPCQRFAVYTDDPLVRTLTCSSHSYTQDEIGRILPPGRHFSVRLVMMDLLIVYVITMPRRNTRLRVKLVIPSICSRSGRRNSIALLLCARRSAHRSGAPRVADRPASEGGPPARRP